MLIFLFGIPTPPTMKSPLAMDSFSNMAQALIQQLQREPSPDSLKCVDKIMNSCNIFDILYELCGNRFIPLPKELNCNPNWVSYIPKLWGWDYVTADCGLNETGFRCAATFDFFPLAKWIHGKANLSPKQALGDKLGTLQLAVLTGNEYMLRWLRLQFTDRGLLSWGNSTMYWECASQYGTFKWLHELGIVKDSDFDRCVKMSYSLKEYMQTTLQSKRDNDIYTASRQYLQEMIDGKRQLTHLNFFAEIRDHVSRLDIKCEAQKRELLNMAEVAAIVGKTCTNQ